MVGAPWLWDEWQWASLLITAHSGIQGDLPDIFSLTKHWGLCLVDLMFPWSRGIRIENIVEKSESMESSLVGDSSKDSTERSSQGELRCLEASKGAAGRIHY